MADELWSFALRTYALPGVAAQCLHWQDAFGADVNLLLGSAWLAAQRRCWSAEHVAALERHCAIWRESAVLPLRAARTAMRSTELYPVLKRAELDAERVQIGMIERWLDRRDVPKGTSDFASCARANLIVYGAGLLPTPSESAVMQLADCLSAA